MRLALVYPEIECSVTNTSTYSAPLGLGSIATYCREKMGSSLDVKILDGSLISHEEQLRTINEFRPDIIGIAPTMASQGNGHELGKLAKNFGAQVFYGGVNSTNLWENMLKNRSFVDGVVLYDGEIPFYLILNRVEEYQSIGKRSLEGIPNLAYRDHDGVIHGPSLIYVPKLGDVPDIDYSLFDLDRFFEQTQKRGFGKAITYYAGKGCSKRGGRVLKEFYSPEEYNRLVSSMNVCTFCGRNELGFRSIEQDREARILRELHDKYDVRGFFNVQDTVNLRNTSPIELNDSWFRLFIGIEEINEHNIEKLKERYGPNLIFQTGVEAANPEMRQAYGKRGTDLRDLESRVQLLGGKGIQLHASFILGGRGETKEFMKKTTEVARKLSEYDNVTWILMSPQLILPGSPDYKMLLQIPSMGMKYAYRDLIDIPEINRDFLRYFAPELTRERILEEISHTFEAISARGRKDLVLDVKGVVGEEEIEINASRPYTKN